ncbi:MAG: diaminopimelate decarboxylase, partial [Dehalococcoidia bacterium]
MDFPNTRLFPATAVADEQGRLHIGGCDTLELAAEFGTPLYIFDEETLRHRCREFVREFTNRHPETTVVYACKAFINRALALLFHQEGLGLDVVSGGELAAARSVDFPPSRVYFHGNNKSPQELQEALEWGIGRVVVDNLQELSLLEQLAGRLGRVQEILLRVSPGVDPHTHAHTTTGTLDSKFGLPIQTGQAEEAVRQAQDAAHLKLVGLHFHLGSPVFETEPYQVALGVVLEFAARLREEGFHLQELSPGGGFAIAYTQDQRPPSVADYAEAIVGTLGEHCQTLGMRLPRLIIEPGRAIVGPAGVALYRVGAVKTIPGVRTYVAVDGGMGDNIRPA